MNFRFALLAATVLAAPVAFVGKAAAQPVTGPYVSVEGGTTIQQSERVNLQGAGAGKAFFSESYSGDASLGYGFGNGFRVEIAGNFNHNNADHVDTASGHTGLSGASNTYGPMVNVLYDFNVGLPIFPYVGAGAGYQWQHFDSGLKSASGNVGGDGGSFAYNIIAGASYPLPWVPGLSVTAEYKFMQLVSSRNYSTDMGNGIAHVGQSMSHSFLMGLRYQLFTPRQAAPAPAPAPAPVAAPAPAPAKTYLVFFDWDKYNLTPRATQIIAQAASDSKTNNVTTLQVSGYTDTSGTPKYNMGLSQRRGQAVAAQLVADGVPASEIEIHAYGDTHLLVPTGPGVREPQNRRVEIVLQ
jgi:outer membrane protein OmpA-like peptidoglycan-associated protein/outer membrane protein W